MAYNREKFKCVKCGQWRQWDEAHEAETVNLGKKRYVCDSCNQVEGYTIRNNANMHKVNGRGIRRGFEFELGFNEKVVDGKTVSAETCYNTLLNGVYNLIPSYDCSLRGAEKNAELKSGIYHNASGLKGMFRTIKKYADTEHSSLGHHINVSFEGLNWEKMDAIRDYSTYLFNPLLTAMRVNPEKCIQVWGRYFSNYSSDTMSLIHGSWLNISSNNRLEFRIAKFMDVNQYFWASELCAEICEKLRDMFLDNGADRKSAIKTGKSIAKLYEKYAQGKARCQSAANNSK